MSRDRKYGEISAERGRFYQGEPLFIFRAKDQFAPLVLRIYAAIIRNHALSNNTPRYLDHCSSVESQAFTMEQWQKENGGLVKIPD
jgi:hypothetical protein